MLIIFVIFVIILYFAFIPVRIAIKNPDKTLKYGFSDIYRYYKYKEYNNCQTGEIVAYVGLFGRGKTLSAVNRVCNMYKLYNDKIIWDRGRNKFVTQKVEILSNVHLTEVPYITLVGLNQIYQAAEKNKEKDIENDTLTVTLVLGDEFSVQLNSRSFKDNINALFLNTLLTCRHHHISLFYTAQRFGHVDALLRQVTSAVVDCDKVWRLQCHYIYDAWEMENAQNAMLLKPLKRTGFFVTNKDYAAYDTLATVQNLKKKFDENDMLSDAEILALQSNQPANMDIVDNPSKSYVKSKIKLQKKGLF